jgi:hypothetical protein
MDNRVDRIYHAPTVARSAPVRKTAEPRFDSHVTQL